MQQDEQKKKSPRISDGDSSSLGKLPKKFCRELLLLRQTVQQYGCKPLKNYFTLPQAGALEGIISNIDLLYLK